MRQFSWIAGREDLKESSRLLFCGLVAVAVTLSAVAQGDRPDGRAGLAAGGRTATESAEAREALRDRIRASRLGAEVEEADAETVTESPEASLTPRQRKFRERALRQRMARMLAGDGPVRRDGGEEEELPEPPAGIAALAEAEAGRAGLPPALVLAVIRVESGFSATAVSDAGAVGLMQLMPGTSALMECSDPTDPAENIAAGTAYLARMVARFEGDLRLALAAYNAGPEAVARHRGVPPYAETTAYVENVLSAAQGYGRLLASRARRDAERHPRTRR